MYLCKMTGANNIFKYMVLQCSKLFYYKVSGISATRFADLISFAKYVGETELSEEKKFSVSSEKDFISCSYIFFC